MSKIRRNWAALAVLAAVLSWAAPADAQDYFGRNKVQYEHFDFKVLHTEHFDIYYYPVESAAAEQAGRMAERWYVRLSQVLNHQLRGRQPVIFYASHPDFEQTNVVEGELDEGTGGVTESARRRVTLPFAGSLQETDHVLGHELVHAFQYDILGQSTEGLPLWFIEGMAEYLSLGSRDVQTAMWLRDAAIENKLPSIDDLDDPRYFPYRFGHAFWAYVGGRWGDETLGRILASIAQVGGQGRAAGPGDAVAAIERATRVDKKTLSSAWQAAVRETYLLDKTPPTGTLIGDAAEEGSLNVGPALSPDGTRIAFLSARDRLSIDLYLADATTGHVLRKLISTAGDPHFQSLQFLASAGSWAPDGRRLAVATVRSGKPVLAVIDTTNGHIDREARFENLGEIFQPAWSPDGHSIAFASQVGGFTDLFVYNLDSKQTRRLTNDAVADLQPTWSPDSRELAFVTERFTGTPQTLGFTGYGLATIDVASGSISPVKSDVPGRMIDPQWSADGRSIFFISDEGGRQNAYRLDRASGHAEPMTDEVTGVAGITPLSPALSIARSGSAAAVSIFHDRGYEIRVRNFSQPVASEAANIRDQAVLPPGARNPTAITQLLHEPEKGLPATTESFKTTEPSHKLELIDVGQAIGASSSPFGTYVNGGIQFTFSDVLGNHMLGTGIAINGGVKDIAGSINYLNREHRWNWGVFGQRLPLVSGSVSAGLLQQNGRDLFVQQTELLRETFTEVGATAIYPLSRATRFEVTASANHIGFDDELRTQTADFVTGDLLDDTTQQLPAPDSLRLAELGAAIVGDTSVFGGTSPILGHRFRVEASPTFGDLRMMNVTADLRKYVMPVRPITLAGRLLHFGRYGGSGEDQRLLPLFLGYSTLVRGYDVNSFSTGDCTPNATSSCPEFDRLVGSRILVANGEVRAPLAGLFTGRLDYGPLPVELFGFADAGMAWTQADKPSFAGGTRDWVTSVGGGARVNVLGYLVAEFSMARPLQRAQPGWVFVFNLQPGF
jgi:Tol biopolymer transport system component